MGWKMVRDRVEQVARAKGVSGTWRIAGHDEAVAALKRKAGEEYLEFIEAGDPAELLDLVDVLDELLRLLDPQGDYAAEHLNKLTSQGRFRDHVMWSPVPNDQER